MAYRSRRPLFRQRKSFGQRLAKGLGVTFVAAVAVLALVYFTLPWTTALALRIFLDHSGWGPASVHVSRFNARGFEAHDVTLGGRAVTLASLAVTYSPRDLIHGRVGDITVNGLNVTAKWAAGDLTIGSMHLPPPAAASAAPIQQPSGSRVMQPFQFRHLVITKTNLVLDLPRNPVTLSVSADLTSANGRWEGQIAADGSGHQGDKTSALFRLGWQGTFSPADFADGPGKGTIDLTAADFPVADSDATVSASGHLDVATGNGGVSLTAPGRIDINVSALHTGSIPGLPEAWISRLANGAAFYAAGSNGGATFIMRNQDGASTLQADLDLGMNASDTSLRAIVRGKASGAQGGLPENVAIDEIQLEGNRIPISVGELSGRVGLSALTGPLILVQGNAYADVTIANPVLGPFTATSLAVVSDGQLHLDGPTIALTPRNLSITAMDATTPALSLPGRTTLALADSGGETQSMGVVLGDSVSPTVTFALSTAAHGVRLMRPVHDGTMPNALTVDLPRTRFDGYVVPGTGLYDVSLHIIDAAVSHSLADMQMPQFSARFLPGGGTGTGNAHLARFMGEPQRPGHNSGGLDLKYDFNLSNYLIDITSSMSTPKSYLLGGFTARLNLADGSGRATLDTPNLTFGKDTIAAQDVFTGSSGISDLVGTAAISLEADWTPVGNSSAGRISLNDLGFRSPRLTVSGLNTKLDLNSLWPLKAEGPQHLDAASVTAGLPFQDLAMDVRLPGDNTIAVDRLSASVAEGHASAASMIVPITDGQTTLPITLTQLGLEPLGAQTGVDGLSATGTVSGVLPVHIENGRIWIDGGNIKSDAPGHLSYRPAVRPPALAKSDEFLVDALTNFDYDFIVASVNGDPLTPHISMALKGRNADQPDSTPVSFGVTFGGAAENTTQHGGGAHRQIPGAALEAN